MRCDASHKEPKTTGSIDKTADNEAGVPIASFVRPKRGIKLREAAVATLASPILLKSFNF